ncbi:hypothetical protein BBB39_00925 [Bordetella trematum]|uniref:Zinc-finger domain-containing protein n=1 Tax=Bordetella trematum TaxID=123899 RepID=A0A157RFE6_9BORD|nr:hypothetical protein [Bordetella trematum]AZR92486.1 hypothetical protein BBB39_00925 [Bordetella trematum]NNH20252.1 hypothetical protein [Bordetella trematum]SAI56650.1 Uncharacterised protein [Bordetella trematum]SAI61104.1 Uncharacterised protein [Bordetella trematum]SAI68677.1 Uncharacterised protein [Bordetella trematum]
MKCRDYVFGLTSGQWEDAAWPTRLASGLHRAMCVRCRRFSANDARLLALAARYRGWLTGEDASPPADPD